MPTRTKITSGSGKGYQATVSKNGQLITSPFAYDNTQFQELATAATAYNFYTPNMGKQFVITGIIAKADKQVSGTVDADVVVYEAGASDTVTADKVLFQMAMVEGDLITLLPLNILVNEGKFVNAKTSDDDIHMTITGYYINTI